MSSSSRPLVSIITPVYNAAAYLPRTLDSVQAQTWPHFEMILVDDCSSDGSAALIEKYLEDSRFRLIRKPKNEGVAMARNTGLDHARGDYLCFLDADDWWTAQKLALQIEFMQRSGAQLSHMDYYRVPDETQPCAGPIVRAAEVVSYQDMLKSNAIGNLSAMVARAALGGARFQRIGHEDYVFWLSVMQHGISSRRVPVEEPQCFYRVHQQSLSANKWRAMRWQWHIYREHLDMPLASACINMGCYVFYALKKRR